MDEQKNIFQLMEQGAEKFTELGEHFEKLADKHAEEEATDRIKKAQTAVDEEKTQVQITRTEVEDAKKRWDEEYEKVKNARADYESAQRQEPPQNEEIKKYANDLLKAERDAHEAENLYMDARIKVAKAEHDCNSATQQVKEAEAWAEQLKALKLSIVWFVHKSKAGTQVFKSAIDRRRIPRAAWQDAVSLRKELQSAFALQLKQTWVWSSSLKLQFTACDKLLNGIGTFLNTLCRNLEASENPRSPQQGFLRIAEHGEQMETDFQAVKNEVEKWVVYFPQGTLKTMKKETQKLVSLSRRVTSKAQRGADTCDVKVVQKNLRILSRDLITVHTSYTNLICQLDFVECRPEVEPPFLFEVRSKLEEAGCSVAKALLVYDSIQIAEESVVTRLNSAWGMIAQQVKCIEEEVTEWSNRQLCPAPGFCQEALVRLQSCTRTALAQIAVLQNDPTCQEVLIQQKESIDCVQAEVMALSEKTQSLKESFNQHVFDKFWWLFTQIRVALTPEEEKDACLLTERQLKQWVEEWKTGSAGGRGGRQFLFHPPTGQVMGVTRPSLGVTSRSAPAVPGNQGGASVSPILERLKKVAELASALQPLIADPLKAQIEQIVSRVQQEQRRLQVERDAGQMLSVQSKQRADRRIRDFYGALLAVHAVTLDSAPSVQKQQLRELGMRLPLLQQSNANGHGGQFMQEKLTAHTARGVAS